jgi:hypothetical protein
MRQHIAEHAFMQPTDFTLRDRRFSTTRRLRLAGCQTNARRASKRAGPFQQAAPVR